jgi:hypothetical protein
LTLEPADSATAEIVVKRVSQTDRFVFEQFPTGVISAHVVGNITGEKAVLPALNFLFQSLTVIGKRWPFAGVDRSNCTTAKENYCEDEPQICTLIALCSHLIL